MKEEIKQKKKKKNVLLFGYLIEIRLMMNNYIPQHQDHHVIAMPACEMKRDKMMGKEGIEVWKCIDVCSSPIFLH